MTKKIQGYDSKECESIPSNHHWIEWIVDYLNPLISHPPK